MEFSSKHKMITFQRYEWLFISFKVSIRLAWRMVLKWPPLQFRTNRPFSKRLRIHEMSDQVHWAVLERRVVRGIAFQKPLWIRSGQFVEWESFSPKVTWWLFVFFWHHLDNAFREINFGRWPVKRSVCGQRQWMVSVCGGFKKLRSRNFYSWNKRRRMPYATITIESRTKSKKMCFLWKTLAFATQW